MAILQFVHNCFFDKNLYKIKNICYNLVKATQSNTRIFNNEPPL